MSKLSKINPEKLYALTNGLGNLHHISQKVPGGSLMQGEFLLSQQVSGIWIHASRVLELQDATSNFELPPGLSFTFMLEGEANFSMVNKDHKFKAHSNPKKINCYAICLAQNEIVSRKIYKGESVYKLNISIDKANLESRCQLAKDSLELNQIFRKHGVIHHWLLTASMRKLVFKLMNIVNQGGLLQNLQIESYTTELLFQVLSQLQLECAKIEKVESKDSSKSQTSSHDNYTQGKVLREKVNALLHQNLELEQIAQKLNMSISTLQRKFKNTCGSTVIEYIRRERLQLVRNKMIREEMTLNEAAAFAGYKYPANFITAFKKAFGTTPYAYCKELSY